MREGSDSPLAPRRGRGGVAGSANHRRASVPRPGSTNSIVVLGEEPREHGRSADSGNSGRNDRETEARPAIQAVGVPIATPRAERPAFANPRAVQSGIVIGARPPGVFSSLGRRRRSNLAVAQTTEPAGSPPHAQLSVGARSPTLLRGRHAVFASPTITPAAPSYLHF